MKEQLQQRLESLKTEYATGQKMLADLETQQANLRDTLLRISGAIQVLEETLNETPADPVLNNTEPATEASLAEVV
jgi:predicted nuclease with TOPRIM domain